MTASHQGFAQKNRIPHITNVYLYTYTRHTHWIGKKTAQCVNMSLLWLHCIRFDQDGDLRLFSPNFYCKDVNDERSELTTNISNRRKLKNTLTHRVNRDFSINEQFVPVAQNKALQIAQYNLAIYIACLSKPLHFHLALSATPPQEWGQ